MLKAAAGSVDLKARPGQWLTGFGGRIAPSDGRLDAIEARALVLSDGTPLAIVSCDLLGFDFPDVEDVRARVQASGAMPGARVLLACTHTHSGPTSLNMRGDMGHLDHMWLEEAKARVADLVIRLAAEVAPCRLKWAQAQVQGIGFNREENGGPLDETLTALQVEGLDGTPIATAAHYATHAVVMGMSSLKLSGDFPGAVARSLSERAGGQGLYLQGACGDVDPKVYADRGWGKGTYDDVKAYGARLADASGEALRAAEWEADPELRFGSAVRPIPLMPAPTPEEAEAFVAQYAAERDNAKDAMERSLAGAMLEWAVELKAAVDRGEVMTEAPSEVWAARIGSVRIVALPFELYTAVGLGIQRGLGDGPALVMGYSNGLWGYLPTDASRKGGGYGPAGSNRWFPRLLTGVGLGGDAAAVAAGIEVGRTV